MISSCIFVASKIISYPRFIGPSGEISKVVLGITYQGPMTGEHA